ncbi:MAG: adenylate/guanylate cyclase domain-containing protein [Ferrovibrio sp.]|uniref:adenylate/guanylate cyclase domain-containing protein n=1 Tax=Ferrovibrio sp. TaxID=1917215 RepID=UPI00260E664A|nr:adenylate/guanylate cyclase domain-containing protein [Ferrovibrio sp.]MCW0232067.1 adenylate/guanylate cyclase domain-containing protein [Ferrovibrio sp.]
MMIPNTEHMPASDIPVAMWLVKAGLDDVAPETLVTGFCSHVVTAGIPLQRVFVGMATLHPLLRARGYTWTQTGGLIGNEAMPHRDPDDEPEAWVASPLRHMLAKEVPELHRPLTRPEAIGDFPVLKEFAEQGLTDWFAMAHSFGWTFENGRHVTDRYAGIGMISSFTTMRAGGFSEDHLTRLRRLVPLLALAVKAAMLTQMSRDLTAAYIGGDAAHRVLNGAIRRGQAERIEAVILYADLRGFTALADRLAIEPLVETLNAYFDCLGPAIEAGGGQVLKFLGDGLLASFQLDGRRSPQEVGTAALRAARAALDAVQALNADRSAAGLPVLALDIALHEGLVMYGNVGTGARLDFTLIGPTVNEASRLENLCTALDRNLLASETFMRIAGSGAGLVSLGRHALRGVAEMREVFGLAQ